MFLSQCYVDKGSKNEFGHRMYSSEQIISWSIFLVEPEFTELINQILYPRSSTGTKTPLRLANSVGIIDSAVIAGNIIAVQEKFDNVGTMNFGIKEGTRLAQICAPNLESFMVSIVEDKEKLGITKRGSKGFGSTGM